MKVDSGSSLWTRNFLLTVLANSAGFFGVQILYPTMPLFLMSLGSDPGAIGIVMGLFTLSAVCSRPFAVYGARRWGRFPMVFVGTLLSALPIAGYYWVGSTAGVAFLRIIHGFGFGFLTTIFAGVVSDMLPYARRGEGLGYFGLGPSLTMTVAPFMGLFLIENVSFLSMFLLAIVTQILALGMIFVLDASVWATPFGEISAKKAEPIQKKSGIISRNLWVPGILSLLFGIHLGTVQGYASVYAKSEGIPGVVWFFVISSIMVCLTRLVSGGIFDRKGPYWVLIPGISFSIISVAFLYWGTSQWTLWGSAAFFGVAMGGLFPALQAWLVNRSPAENRTGANAVFFNCLDLGVGGGMILLGYLANGVGYRQMYGWGLVVVGLFLLLAIGNLIFEKKDKM